MEPGLEFTKLLINHMSAGTTEAIVLASMRLDIYSWEWYLAWS
jgi:hypothetical protein